MDLLYASAYTFHALMENVYTFILGRKGHLKEVILGFSEEDFHHLVGLHKLKDLDIARANRQKVFRDILAKRITCNDLKKSSHFQNISNRLETFPRLETLLDTSQLVFRYNSKLYPYSAIKSELLIKMGDGIILEIAFLFLDKKDKEKSIYFCRSFFPLEKKDYTEGQMKYTLLKKEKKNLHTGQTKLLYDKLTSNEQNSK